MALDSTASFCRHDAEFKLLTGYSAPYTVISYCTRYHNFTVLFNMPYPIHMIPHCIYHVHHIMCYTP